MKKQGVDGRARAAKLRWRAEEAALKKGVASPSIDSLAPGEMQRMIHELRVHQIELEMQNAELRRVQTELEAARARYFDLYNLAPVGYFILSLDGRIQEANLTAVDLLGVARASLVTQPITRYIFKDDQDTYYLHRQELLATGRPHECQLRMVKKDGTTFLARLTATPATSALATDKGPVSRLVLSVIPEPERAVKAKAKPETRRRKARKRRPVGAKTERSKRRAKATKK